MAAVAMFSLHMPDTASAAEPGFDAGREVATAVSLLERWHLSDVRLNDELSSKWFDALLAHFDPRKMYFLQPDLLEFEEFRSELDDLAESGDLRFANLLRERLQVRVKHARGAIEESLAGMPDVQPREPLPEADSRFAADATSLHERWRRRIEHEVLVELQHGREWNEIRLQLRDRYDRIERQARDLTDERLCTIYLNSLLACVDPDSAYLSRTYLETFSQSIAFSTFTLAVRLRPDAGKWLIAGFSPEFMRVEHHLDLVGWELLAVRDSNGHPHDVVEMHAEDLHQLVYPGFGSLESDSQVELELLHPDTFKRRTVPWVRHQLNGLDEHTKGRGSCFD